MRIVQMADIHVGSGLFRPELLLSAIEETNSLQPDLVTVVGDLTMEGYRWEFEEAKEYLDRLECPNVVVGMGNHDARNVGYRHFEDLFGMRELAVTVPVPEGEAKVVVLDSTKPDLDEGEVGREHYRWFDFAFRGRDKGPAVAMIPHHILLHSGTVSSMRVRGTMPPSYNVIDFDEESVKITLREPGKGEGEPLASFARAAVTTSEFYPDFERFVSYDLLPFLKED